MKILGVDPGTVVMGYGVIEGRDDAATALDYGAITVPKNLAPAARLHYLHTELIKVVARHRPDAVAVEQPFVAKNVRTALAIGRAQAIALLAAAACGIPVYEYTPRQVKQRVADYGAGGKEQVQEMVRLQLGLAEPPEPLDAADALAVALCHLQEQHVSELLAERGGR